LAYGQRIVNETDCLAGGTHDVGTENYLQQELNKLIQNDVSPWRFLQEGSLDGVWYWDLENVDNEWMSPEFWRTFGVDPDTMRHDPAEWQHLIFPDDLAVALKNFEAHCADPDHPYDQVVRYLHADGSTVWIRCRGLAIRDKTGKPIRMLGAHTNITAVKKSEENAKAGWRAAEAANAELRSFAYSVSHDMKAPANTLSLLLSEFEHHMDGRIDADGQEMLDMCSQTVARMQTLIEYVLDYTRIIGMEPKFETVSVRDTVQSAVCSLKADIDARGAQIRIGPMPRIKAVREQMTILFQNLISNAIKFCPVERTPHIEIAQIGKAHRDTIEITVKDNGMGIPEQSKERIFKLFQRLHGHDEIKGTGIGLPMCQHIALNHQGEIKLTSTPGEGSAFSLLLPKSMVA